MGPYTKTASDEVFDDGWKISEGDGHVIAHAETEFLADVLLNALVNDPPRPPAFDEDTPHGEGEIAYCYLDHEDEPLTKCPRCGHDLTAPGGVKLVLAVGGQPFETKSRLTKGGELEDTEDGAVANGFHSGTYCGGCDEPLTPWEMEGIG